MSGERVIIRDANLPEDEPALAGFVDALQRFEHDFEPDRRIDEKAGRDYLAVLLDGVRKNGGRIFVAEQDGRAVGWAVFMLQTAPVYVEEGERQGAIISELFIEEDQRGTGLGRRLMDVCTEEARARGISVLHIGVHARNARARKVYESAGFAPYMLSLRKYL
jgi:GNAT superfamily N-acetyltransferase